MTPQHKELVEELNKHRIEVSRLRNTLNELDKEKESCFKKKEEFSKKIKDCIQKIKDNKAKRDSLTQEVKKLKLKRNSVNKNIMQKLTDFDNLKKEKEEVSKKLDVRESSSRIRQHIEKLEFKIETEAISFEKEKELMKKIRELGKLHDNASALDEANKKIRDSSDEIRKMRKEANETHRLIQEKAKESQVLHEEILKISAKIDKMKFEEDETFKKFFEFRKQFHEVNYQLKDKLKLMNDVKSQLDKIHLDKKERRKQEEESFLKSKGDAVNEKIRKGQKLTTEDLLVFQRVGRK